MHPPRDLVAPVTDSSAPTSVPLGPLERYERSVAAGQCSADPEQRIAVEHLDRLYAELMRTYRTRKGRIAALVRRRSRTPARGVYLWGGVGRGKTMLVDLLHESLPFAAKERTHFHRFMQGVHHALRGLREERDPLDRVAEQFADRSRVLCLDEFHVSDIADAMLLAGLLRALLDRGVALVATSNEAPSRLYWGGLQRERFLPAIALLEAHLDVVHLDGSVDYRLRALEAAEIYHTPLDADADASLDRAFSALAPEPGVSGASIELDGRPLATVRAADGVVWVEFEALCGGARGVRDYIDLARCHQTLVLANVPQLDAAADDRARRFIHLIDELYDRNVKLVISAAAAPADLYRGERLRAPFQRTASRLAEMQSLDYLARPHLSD